MGISEHVLHINFNFLIEKTIKIKDMKRILLLIAIAFITNINAQTWEKIEIGGNTADFEELFFIGNTGWAMNDNNQLYKTSNGGDSWSVVNQTGELNNVTGLWFTSENIGYTVGNGLVEKTTDGGVNWSTIYDIPGDITFTDLIFVNDNTAWTNKWDHIYKTVDGGYSWTEEASFSDADLINIEASDENHIYYTGYGHGARTDNGGVSWTEDDNLNFYCMHSVNTNLLWAGRNNGKLFKSTDGINWTEQNVGTNIIFEDIDFYNEQKGIAVGAVFNLLYTTEDGGETWNALEIETNSLKKVEFVNENTAIAVGDEGYILKVSFPNSSPELNANFTANQITGTAPLNVSFTNTSTGEASSWEWDFDNDGIVDASSQDASFVYSTPGTYTVKLTISNGTENNTETKTDYITVVNSNSNCYLEDFTTDPNFTSLSSSHAYWDQSAGNYIVRTYDNLDNQYWAYSPSFTTFSNSNDINIDFDILCEQGDFGTYPGVYLYGTEPTEMLNDTKTLRVSFVWSNGEQRKIKIEDFNGHTYLSSNSYEDNTWYHVKLQYNSTTGKTDFLVTESSNGDVFYQENNIDITLNDFSYLGLGYYDTANYGDDWSPIRIDNIAICSPSDNNTTTCLSPTNYIMNFENNEDMSAWSKLNANDDDSEWGIYESEGINSSQTAAYKYNTNNAADDWFFSPCFDLEVEKEYEISFYYAAQYSSFPEKLKLLYGTENNASMSNQVVDLGEFNNTEFVKSTSVITVSSNDSYYFGWYCYSATDMGYAKIDSVHIRQINADAINIVSKENLQIYPNPAQDLVTISFNSDNNNNEVSIYNISGKLLFQQTESGKKRTIDVSFLEKGIYILQIKNKEYSINKQLIIN